LPQYFRSAPADFHAELFVRLESLHLTRQTNEAIIAPRDGAKSTLITFAYVLWCALEAHERYILILQDSADQAHSQLAALRAEIESNGAILRDYPNAAGVGPVWRQDRIGLRNGVAIQALGTGGRVRGRKNRDARPTLIIFDDVENNDTITSEVKRSRAWRWATREVIPAGESGTNFLSVGSALHRHCVAMRLGTLPGWQGRTFKAVHSWPLRMDLWDEWERLATNLADLDRGQTATAFYRANRETMDDGALIYWPMRWPLVALMERRAAIGHQAFDTEYQGVPSMAGLTEWPPELFEEQVNKPLWFNEWPTDLVFKVLALDPSKGANARTSDFQAHVLVGLDRSGVFWVEGWLNHETPLQMVARSLDLFIANRPDVLRVEVDSLGLLLPEYQQQMQARKMVVNLRPLVNRTDKIVRIRRTGSYLERNQIRYRRTRGTQELVNQKRDFPHGEHDDGPDAEEMAIRTIEEMFHGS